MNGESRRRDFRYNRSSKKHKLIRTAEEELEAKLGFDLFSEGEKRLGWLLTFASVSRFCCSFLACLVNEKVEGKKKKNFDFEF